MNTIERLEGDLHFVRGALDASARPVSPPSLYFLWAAIVLVGFTLADVQPRSVPEYWTVAAPAGFLVSAFLGWRHARRIGQASVSTGRQHLLHWGAVITIIALAVLLGTGRAMPSETLDTQILLMLALGYFTAGLHLDRSFLWVGLLMGIGAVVVTVVSVYAWTTVGVALAVSLTIAGLKERPSREATA